MHKQIGQAALNWFVFLTSPLWVLFALIFLAFTNEEMRRFLLGRESVL